MKDKLKENADKAKIRFNKNPTLENLIWFGRRTAYTGNFEESIKIYTHGIEKFGDKAELYRHRGHRYISIRKFDKALNDLQKASTLIDGTEDKIEEDGIPNTKNIPLSTLQFNIHYHLGLVNYLIGNYDRSIYCFNNCYKVSKNDDSRVAATYWLYLNSIQSKTSNQFPFPQNLMELEIIENFSYHNLLLLFSNNIEEIELMNKIDTDIDRATANYGLGLYYLKNGQIDKAKNLFNDNVENQHPAAFGTIASEIELGRI